MKWINFTSLELKTPTKKHRNIFFNLQSDESLKNIYIKDHILKEKVNKPICLRRGKDLHRVQL